MILAFECLRAAVCVTVITMLMTFAPQVRAQDHLREPLDVGGELHGAQLGQRIAIFEDKSGTATVAQVSQAQFRPRFIESRATTPNFGIAKAVYWLRLDVRNSRTVPRSWLLELGYPHLDHVSLFAPKPDGGFKVVVTGDTFPFSQRDIRYRNFLFDLEEAPSSRRTLYLRVATTGSMILPLVAWNVHSFIEEQHHEWMILCIFYGIVLIMALYHACIYLLVRQSEFLYYVAFVIALGLLQLTLMGHTFEYFLPNHPWLANHAMPISLGLLVLTACLFAINYVQFNSLAARCTTFLGTVVALLGVSSFVLEYAFVIRAQVLASVLTCLVGSIEPIRNLREGDRRSTLYLAGWGFFLVGSVVNLVRMAGLIPTNSFTTWGMQLGAIVQIAFLSTALGDKINVMRADLAMLNGELSDKVSALQNALTSAEEATARAERATRVKDEFMATMSHEFRTPLNAIINIPQGLLEQFPVQRLVVCSSCASTFELDADEKLAEAAACPECNARALAERNLQRYVGQPEHTARYLSKIERSGTHLLQVVNSILDFSALEAGHLRITRERVDAVAVVLGTIDQMSDLAERGKVTLRCGVMPDAAFLHVDPLRLRQVLINLLGNAIKFSDGHGTVTVELTELAESYRFSVRDQGIGIAEQNLEDVFTSFKQVDAGNTRRFGGTGLGLSISRTLVRMHGGQMWVESKLGKGACFFFSIPKPTPNLAEQRRPSSRSSSLIQQRA